MVKPNSVELIPDLDNCIETVSKREYREAVQQLLQKGTVDELGERIEILRMFLESTDFRQLRAESEKHLTQGQNVKFILQLDEGQVKHQMIVE